MTDKFALSTLVRGAEQGAMVPFGWYAWLLVREADKKTILVDTGFNDEDLAKKWNVSRFEPVDEILGELGISADRITDVIVTHMHWDHAGNLSSFRKAKVWIQPGELESAKKLVSEEVPEKFGIRFLDVETVSQIEKEGRLHRIGKPSDIGGGIVAHLGGKHTEGSQWLEVTSVCPKNTIVLASDIAYLYRNIEEGVSSRSTTNPKEDVEQISLMKKTATSSDLIVPGHDPAVSDRFPKVSEHIVEITATCSHPEK